MKKFIKVGIGGFTVKVFIGWSGDRSQTVAEIFNRRLSFFLHSCEPFFSDEIGKGNQWLSDITEELKESAFGIICLTKENLNEPWILFEAGALSKGLKKNHVCPFLLDLRSSDVTGPLAQFQDTKNTKKDLLKLIKTINSSAKEPINESLLTDNFEKWYPDFENEIKAVSPDEEIKTEESPVPGKSDFILEEILETVRDIKRGDMDLENVMGKPGRAIAYKNKLSQIKTMLTIKTSPVKRGEIIEALLDSPPKSLIRFVTPPDKEDEIHLHVYGKPSDKFIHKLSSIPGVVSIFAEDYF